MKRRHCGSETSHLVIGVVALHIIETEHGENDTVQGLRHLRRRRVDEYLLALLLEAGKAGVEGRLDLRRDARRGDEEPVGLDGNVAQSGAGQIIPHDFIDAMLGA